MRSAIVLAAGAGTRMNSDVPKVLHELCGLPMIEHVLRAVDDAGVETPVVVVGHGAEAVERALAERRVDFVLQKEQLGTGHAVGQAAGAIPGEGTVLVLCGDTPLVTEASLTGLQACHESGRHAATVLTTRLEEPTGYGRIVRGPDGDLRAIVEEKDASPEQKAIREINSGMYCFDAARLKEALKELDNDNSQGEYYLTDVIAILRKKGYGAGAFVVDDPREVMGVNNRVQLARAAGLLQERIQTRHMLAGVTIVNPADTVIDADVAIGRDTRIQPGSLLRGRTRIGSGCVIGPRAVLENARVGDGTAIRESTILESEIGESTKIGPYAYVRPGSRIGNDVKLGDFVEVKNSVLGDGTKASHLAYIGDADVGEGVNISCGVVFVNYDGKRKHRTRIGDGAFIGCNANLIAPVSVGDRAYVAAGTTVTENVPEGALCIGRSRQVVKEDWVDRKWPAGQA